VRIHAKRPTSTITEHGYNPYRQAENLRLLPISHAKELLRDDRNLRVHVVHPWFNLSNYTEFGGAQREFFRAMTRRLGFDLSRDPTPLPGAPAGVSVQDAAKRTSGVLFLIDHTVNGTPERSPSTRYNPSTPLGSLRGFLYLNPNALPSSDARYVLERLVEQAGPLLAVYDDFANDTY
jgi:hypothetical protein